MFGITVQTNETFLQISVPIYHSQNYIYYLMNRMLFLCVLREYPLCTLFLNKIDNRKERKVLKHVNQIRAFNMCHLRAKTHFQLIWNYFSIFWNYFAKKFI